MKKIFFCAIFALMLISSCFTLPSQKVYAANISDNSVVILTGSVNEQNKLVVEANLTVNTGISGMTLELSYNSAAMVLSNVVLGSALASLEPITTNTQTDEGFSITPFVFNYFGQENDFSTGNLFTLTFDLLEDVEDGNYSVALKYTKNKDVNYYENNIDVKTKNLFIDNIEVQIKENSVLKVVQIVDENKSNNEQSNLTLIIVLCVTLPVVAGCGVFVAIKLSKKQRNWKKL